MDPEKRAGERRAELVIDAETPSLNKSFGQPLRERMRTKKRIKNAVLVAVLTCGKHRLPRAGRVVGLVYLHIHCYRWQRISDNDNLVPSCKSLIDALVLNQVLADDSDKHIAVTYDQSVDRKKRRTHVTLRWVPQERSR